MNHPFFRNRNTFYFYCIVWILIASIHTAVLIFFYLYSLQWALADSLIFNSIFFVLGLSIWFPLEYYKKKETVFNVIINHLTILAIIEIIWIGAGYNMLSWVASENGTYLVFLNDSLMIRALTGVFYYSNTVLIYYVLSYYKNLQDKIKNEARLEKLLNDAELNFLKAQINPHFLFNSLNSVSALTIVEPEKAHKMIIQLSDFLRYSISQPENSIVKLENEIQNIRRYLEIEKIRFSDKLNFSFDLDKNCINGLIPVMLLQPLYENAIKHGVYESLKPVFVDSKINLENNVLTIIISNDYEITSIKKSGAGIGLQNVKERLFLIFGSHDLIRINKTESLFQVELKIPQNSLHL
ncbi:MAG: histidine kinase [Bacteroidales bacterium]|nr:histidine kinase [Bacteroidales bacterium]